jgi:hypothetical protein
MNPKTRCSKSLPWSPVAIAVVGLLLAARAFADNPIPQVVGPVKPQAVAPGSAEFTLTVYGANFVSGAVVNWNAKHDQPRLFQPGNCKPRYSLQMLPSQRQAILR